MAKTLSQLRAQVRQKADIENDGKHITDAEVDAYINDSIKVLYSLVVDGTNGTFFAKNSPVLVNLGTYSYQLPSDFYQLVSVDVRRNGSEYIRSYEADPQEYAQLTTLEDRGFYSPRKHFLRFNPAQARYELFVFPPPDAVADIAVQYVPAAPSLSLDADTLNFPSFWHQWVVYDSAIQCVLKDSNDPTLLQMEREKVERRIRDEIRSMSTTEVRSIRRVPWGPRDRWRW